MFVALILALSSHAEARQAAKVPRIGFVTAGSSSTIAARIEALRQGLRDLGYLEDKNIIIEWRFAEGKVDRIPALVAELVRLKVDVLLSAGAAVTGPAKNATNTIPVVMAQDTDPVGNGFVASLARPGGNITGLSSYSAELNGKRLELLKGRSSLNSRAWPWSGSQLIQGTLNRKKNGTRRRSAEITARIPGRFRS